MTRDQFGAVNAILNGLSALLLLAGFIFIRNRKVKPHLVCMLLAFTSSALFLASYITAHILFPTPKSFTYGEGALRKVYLSILLTHTVLAVVILPLIFMTLSRAFHKRFDKHRKIARWAFPLWLYVSVTGVIIYFMLYHLPG